MLVLDRTVILLIWRLQCWQHCQSVRERMSDDHIPIIWYSDSAKKRRRRNAKNMKLYTPCSVVRVQLQCYGRVFWKLLCQPKINCTFFSEFGMIFGVNVCANSNIYNNFQTISTLKRVSELMRLPSNKTWSWEPKIISTNFCFVQTNLLRIEGF